MNHFNKISFAVIIAGSMIMLSCKKDHHDTPKDDFDTAGTYTQVDQMARPAINTVFVGADRKNEFNTTVPSAMSGAFKSDFVAKLNAFGYTTNILGLNADAFAGVLVTDVLNVKTNGTTTFYDGTNVLTGRALGDDVIDVELTLLFGGSSGSSNPGLTSDHVNGNDKPFLTQFPYLASPF
ncbi:MAG: DUF4331 family protein [Agriterribacter sp.]